MTFAKSLEAFIPFSGLLSVLYLFFVLVWVVTDFTLPISLGFDGGIPYLKNQSTDFIRKQYFANLTPASYE